MSRFSRRGLLTTGAAAGVLAATGLPVRAAGAKRGGTLRLGLSGGHAADFDSRVIGEGAMRVLAQGGVFDCLTEIAANGELIGELAESWEARSDARVWTFRTRGGVTFHDGRPFTAEDAAASLRLHLSDSPAESLLAGVREIRATGRHVLRVVLEDPNPDLPLLLADHRFLIYPACGTARAMAEGIGTGLYRVETFRPGYEMRLRRVDRHWKDGRAGWFDRVEARIVPDAAMRREALAAGALDMVDRIDPAEAQALADMPGVRLIEQEGNQHYAFRMDPGIAPFDRPEVRAALRLAVDRQGLLDAVLGGRGALANDHPVGPANPYRADLPQRGYDPSAARALLAAAGLPAVRIALTVSEAAFPGAVRAARHFRESAAAAGFDIRIDEVTAAEWPRAAASAPFAALASPGRPTEDWVLSTEPRGGGDRLDRLLRDGRAALDPDRRRAVYSEVQRRLHADGDTVIPVYARFLDAASSRLAHGPAVGTLAHLDSARAIERWWVA